MVAAVRANWALLVGVLMLMLGHGLQGTLLGVRAAIEHFPTTLTGFVMSAYYLGFLGGSAIVPNLIARVGHVRVFAALGSVSSTTVLLHAVFVDPATWFAIRFLTGVALCGLFITAESWLNSKASNDKRGQILSAYMVIQLGGLAGGQLLLNLAPPSGYDLFITVSVLLSVAVVPMLLTAVPAPVITASRRVGLRSLYQASPLGAMAIFSIGIAHGGLYGLGAVFAREAGLSVAAVSLFMALTVLGGMIFQWPIGWLSDRFDRRLVITVVTCLAGATALVAAVVVGSAPSTLFALFFLLAGLSLPMYSLCVAHANDYLSADDMVGASGTLLLANGSGAVLGPIGAAAAMDLFGAAGFPLFIGALHGIIGAFALWRMTRRAAPPLEEQAPTVPLPMGGPVTTNLAQVTAVEQSSEVSTAEQELTEAA
ncbi:MFS transporter [Geminicoccaceae bacterium 1502E]|nr:MFS transporter [Geminicoccaceae bacterium 1502E]